MAGRAPDRGRCAAPGRKPISARHRCGSTPVAVGEQFPFAVNGYATSVFARRLFRFRFSYGGTAVSGVFGANLQLDVCQDHVKSVELLYFVCSGM